MNDPQAPENVAARASQEDPIIMYLIVRESLGMGVGKTAAQCAHASQMLLLKHLGLKQSFDYTAAAHDEPHMRDAFDNITLFQEWLGSSFRKVVLKADEKEWAKLKEDMEPMDVMVVDAGLTEIEPGSETVIGLHPMRKSLVGKLVKRLQVLK
jgi:peptidyl-tRNA hydrolase